MTAITATLIPATKVTINFTEAGPFDGLSIEGGNVWAKAEALLSMLLADYRRQGFGGYAKTNFTVEWADGDTYTGRIDLDSGHPAVAPQSLGAHVDAYIDAVLDGTVSWAKPEQRDGLQALRDTHEITH